MFVCNMKVNRKKALRLVLILIVIIVISIIMFSVFSIFKSSKDLDKNENSNTLEITSNEYTQFLKSAHENLDDYVNMTVNLTGYIYRLPDFGRTQFVLSRTMILNSSNSAVVVGILSEYEDAPQYKDGDWVNVTGTIIRGNYKGEMPILHITEINKCEPPEDEFVYPPTDGKSI